MITAVSTTEPVTLFSNKEAFISATQRLPLLQPEEEKELVRRYQEESDHRARETLVLSHLKLVVSITRQYRGYGLPEVDLIQEGTIGLLKAVTGYDPEKGARFATYALQWVKAEIHEYIIRNWRMVKVATTKPQRRLFFKLRSAKTGFGAMTPTEVRMLAAKLGVKEAEVVEMEVRLGGMDAPLETDNDEDRLFSSGYLATSDTEPTQVLYRRSIERAQISGLHVALSELDERSRHIVQSRWLNEDNPATLQDLACHYGISAERVRQIESKALKSMRDVLSQYVQ